MSLSADSQDRLSERRANNHCFSLGSGVTPERFKAVANRILNECFLLRQAETTRNDYWYLLNNQQVFSDFFDLLGYELIIQKEQGVVALSNPSGTGRLQLNKISTVLLLILRLIYIEKRKELLQTKEVIITAEEIYERYGMLKLRTKLDKTSMRNSLGLLRRFHIINNLDRDLGLPETRIVVYHSVMLAVPADSLDIAYNKAQA
ncbi:DUF4194 domain-containing protein, partial [bacterium]|nr:DUF4194 domain-containing protein [bacterium]